MSFVVSNTIDCLRLHPSVSNKLNETAIGDFLLFGLNQERNTTTFADIQKFASGAFVLTFSGGKIRLHHRWRPSSYARSQ